ncbi:MAG: EF-P lysine aminoacylase GenX [Planctomycetota bacterium]|nr:MAG: EF-P lysine aminoacylase GenX [Planctomycetota bacterium]
MADALRLRRHPQAAAVVRARARLLAALRERLGSWGLVECDPSPLAPVAGPEPYLHAPLVELPGLGAPLWLQTSPELGLKRLLAAGVPELYALGKSFRGGREELSRWHQPVFSMLEWYRLGHSTDALEDDCVQLGEAAAAALDVPSPTARRSLSLTAALAAHAGLELGPLLDGDTAAFAAAARRTGLTRCRDTDNATALLGRVLVERVEPALAALPGWTFLHGWPACVAAMSQLDPADPRLCLRVEAYMGGLELANGYVELLDAQALAARWDELTAERDGRSPPRDEALLQELAARPPAPTLGMALGVDRLAAALTGSRCLADVLPLALELAEPGSDPASEAPCD